MRRRASLRERSSHRRACFAWLAGLCIVASCWGCGSSPNSPSDAGAVQESQGDAESGQFAGDFVAAGPVGDARIMDAGDEAPETSIADGPGLLACEGGALPQAPDASGDFGVGQACVDDAVALADEVLPLSPSCACATPASPYSSIQPLGFGYLPSIDKIPSGVVYLTFDDGPSDWTDEILDTLAARNVRATFFVNARNFKGSAGLDGTFTTATGGTRVFRDVVLRESDDGHVIGNHTVDHLDLATLDLARAASELDENEALVNAALVKAGGTPRPLTLIRPPWGSPWYRQGQPISEVESAGRLIANRGINVLWTLDSTDSREWAQGESYTRVPGRIVPAAGAPSYADKLARIKMTVLNAPAIVAGAGAIILFHDTHNTTRDAIGDIVDGLRAAGYSFGTIEELAHSTWGRESLTLTPGPGLFASCSDPRDWGCDQEGQYPICGRVWRVYEEAGGRARLGTSLGAMATDAATGVISQVFERGTLELHPEAAQPCSGTVSSR
jgi:peptidoglycan/xylan/chitin deacetylase (PgdA/CDA1 family)